MREGGAALHIFGPAAKNAHLWSKHLNGRCPRGMAWGAGAGVVVNVDGDLVAVRSAPAAEVVVTLQGANARDLAMNGDNVVFYTTTSDKLQSWAPFDSNAAAQDLLPGRAVKKVCCGIGHCLAIDDEGVTYSWATRKGGGKKGVLGRVALSGGSGVEEERENPHIPAGEEVPAPISFNGVKGLNCACGDNHSLVVGTDGEVWTFGSDRWMQLGLASWNKGASHQLHPQRVTAFDKLQLKAAWAVCGGDHTVVVTTDGQIVAWGRGKEGQLGLEGNPFTSQPKVISGTTCLPSGRPVAVAAALQCTVVAFEDKHLSSSLWWLGHCPSPAAEAAVRGHATGREGVEDAEHNAHPDYHAFVACEGRDSEGLRGHVMKGNLPKSYRAREPAEQGSEGDAWRERAEVMLVMGSAQGGSLRAGGDISAGGGKAVACAVIGHQVEPGAGCASCRAKAFLLRQLQAGK
jgi:hypothetical protein